MINKPSRKAVIGAAGVSVAVLIWILYRLELVPERLVLHGPTTFWPAPWELDDVGNVATIILAVFAVVYATWLLLAQRVYRAYAIRQKRWPVQVSEISTTITENGITEARLTAVVINAKFSATPAKWTFTPTNYPRVLVAKLVGPTYVVSNWTPVDTDVGSQLPFEKEFAMSIGISKITQLDIEQQRQILNGNFPLKLKVRAVLPPKNREVAEITLSPRWENEVSRQVLTDALETNLISEQVQARLV